ncbi:50S ribosomal protein L4 [Patescibacteria group bacterium]|nr:50S ribosomal protein L4 [Patescibacteria group bacterium]MCL5091670.1 50S ribosomal protein L4 [Patescibacteria group bacterium]
MVSSSKATSKTAGKKTPASASGVPVYSQTGQAAGQLPWDAAYAQEKINLTALTQYVRIYRINQRQGTVSTKTRGEVSGSTRKIYRQKGTGRARHGDIKAPIFVGGGVVGGPKPRRFHAKMNKRQNRALLLNALAWKIKETGVVGCDDAWLALTKTKQVSDALTSLKRQANTILLVLPDRSVALAKSARNLAKVTVTTGSDLNPYAVLNHQLIVFNQSCWNKLFKKQP